MPIMRPANVTPLLLAALLLAACSSPGERAEREYLKLEQSGASELEKCQTASMVARVWLGERNPGRYVQWKSMSEFICAQAKSARPPAKAE